MGTRAAIVLVCVAAIVSCGGKTTDSGSSGGAGSAVLTSDVPPPTCTEICDRLTSLCSGSPNEKCPSDCQVTESKYQTCPDALDRFLRCMGATRVECKPGEVVVIDCSTERVALEGCGRI